MTIAKEGLMLGTEFARQLRLRQKNVYSKVCGCVLKEALDLEPMAMGETFARWLQWLGGNAREQLEAESLWPNIREEMSWVGAPARADFGVRLMLCGDYVHRGLVQRRSTNRESKDLTDAYTESMYQSVLLLMMDYGKWASLEEIDAHLRSLYEPLITGPQHGIG